MIMGITQYSVPRKGFLPEFTSAYLSQSEGRANTPKGPCGVIRTEWTPRAQQSKRPPYTSKECMPANTANKAAGAVSGGARPDSILETSRQARS